ncbi:MAG TPA: hypothetical protein VGI57_16535 [Usitatibacter sp.]
MTAKQQIATGLLATLIVCSVAFMPANADTSTPAKPASHAQGSVVATKANTPEAPHDSSRDLTYN